MASEPIIRLTDVHKSYGRGSARTPVLRGVSLTVEAGEIVAMVGQSGSGKSTLLNIVGSLDQYDEGKVEVLGRDYAKASEKDLAALRNREIGFVFQAFNLIENLTCLQNVILPASFSGDSAGAQDRGQEALGRVGLADLADRVPGELSGGQKQRVAIARALFSRPRLLLCDEPTGNLDTETGREVIEFFGELNRDDGVTLLIVTHEARLSSFARRVVRIRDGLIIGEGELPAEESNPAGEKAVDASDPEGTDDDEGAEASG